MGTSVRRATSVSLWPGESVVDSLERLARAWDLDHVHFIGRSGALGRVELRAGMSDAGRPWARRVPWADVVCLAGELLKTEGGRPVVIVKAVLRRVRVLERGRAEYLSGVLVTGEVRRPVDLVLSDGVALAEPVAEPRASRYRPRGEAAAVFV